MRNSHGGWTDDRVERLMGNLLRFGVSLATLVVLVGGGVYLVRDGATRPEYGVFRSEPAALRGPVGILGEAWSWHGVGVIQLGLLLLIATPVARVVFSVIAFALQRDLTYVAITLIVLAVLTYSLVGTGV